MAKFKILRGLEAQLPEAINDGYCYLTTDKGNLYIDISDSERVQINAKYAESAGKLQIQDTIVEIDDIVLTTRTINGKPLSENITLTMEDIVPGASVTGQTLIKAIDGYKWGYSDTVEEKTTKKPITFSVKTSSSEQDLIIEFTEEAGGEGGIAGVTSFNGRTGEVVPQTGDYTAEQVGAIPVVQGTEGQFLGFTGENMIGAVPAPKSASKRTARFVVGTSTAGWTADDCDYLCDGTDDQVEINLAIDALPQGGGEVVILDGTYNLSGGVFSNKPNVTITGSGAGTRLVRMEGFFSYIVEVRYDNCVVRNLFVDGNKQFISSQYVNTGLALTGEGSIAENIYAKNNKNDGIRINGKRCFVASCVVSENNIGINFGPSSSTIITGNICNNNDYGIYVSSNSNTITGNTCIRGTGTSGDYTSSQYTILASAENNLVTGNNCMGKAPIDRGTNNTLANNKY